LTVIAIISTLGGLTVTALSGVSSSRASANGASLVADVLLSARQQAVSSGQPVAVVFSSRIRPEKPQAMMLLEGAWKDGVMQWSPSSRWQTFGNEISVIPFARDQVESLYLSNSKELSSSLEIPLQGEKVTNYFYLIYRPNGSIDAPQTAPSVAIRKQNKESVNDYVVVAQENTGRIKIVGN
jgi:Tfp pilus assembly protein FimT